MLSERQIACVFRHRALGAVTYALFFGLLAPAAAGAGDKALGAPSYDHATETTYRTVTWDDFQGKGRRPSAFNRWQTGSFAHIATTVRLNKYQVEEWQVDGEWRARAGGIRPYAVMNKDFSAVRHGSRDPSTLAHEQLHFDITELVARRLAVEMAAIEGRGDLRQDARADLERQIRQRFDEGMREFSELQERYDEETEHGMRKKAQKKWAAKGAEMFREATETLEALLAEGDG